MNQLLEEAQAVESQVIGYRRHIHEHPEKGFYLPETTDYVMSCLKSMGIEPQMCGGAIPPKMVDDFEKVGLGRMEEATGAVATIGSGEPCILLRADMDALPLDESSDVAFKSQKSGIMHACGHDAHTAMLLGAARILKDHESELKGTVKLMFQPGEEMGCGSRLMMDHGLLQNPRVDAAFAIHVMPDLSPGCHFAMNEVTASMDTFVGTIQGKGGHSSMPYNTIDANMIATQLYTQLNLLITRESDPLKMVTFTIGVLNGGTATNIIPDTATFQGNMRTLSKKDRDHLIKRIPEMVDHVCAAWRGTASLSVFSTPTTNNDPAFMKDILPSLESVFGADRVIERGPMSGSEDFSHISQEVPAGYVFLGTGGEGCYPVHSPHMTLDESMFKYGVAAHVAVARDWLSAHAK